MQHKIVFATNNQHKLREIQEMLGTHFTLVSLKEIGFMDDIPETQPTLEGNAMQKARFIYDRFHMPCFADDTGLEVDALHGAPGVFSARFSGNLADFGSEEKRTEANIQKLLTRLSGQSNRKARFRTAIAFVADNHEFLFEGKVEGHIIEQKKGEDGFGYDPIFVPEGSDLTFAEMPSSEKNKISHRGRAFMKFVEFMRTYDHT